MVCGIHVPDVGRTSFHHYHLFIGHVLLMPLVRAKRHGKDKRDQKGKDA